MPCTNQPQSQDPEETPIAADFQKGCQDRYETLNADKPERIYE